MKISPYIFREYDIRGKVGEDFTEEVVKEIGKAYGTIIRRKGGRKICCGRDGRLSSSSLQEALIEGILSTGIEVINIGICPTPVMYFSLFAFEDSDGGIQVTGSHNPPEFNGLKICVGKDTIFGPQIQEIRKIIEKKDYEKGNGKIEEREILNKYIDYVCNNIELKRPLKVVLDPGNGVCSLTAPEIFKRLGCEVECLFCEIDGTFPNHFPDPVVPENLKWLKDKVLKGGYEVGFGYDGDGDRLGVIDEKGNIIWGDQLLIILAKDLLKKYPGAKIIGEVKCSRTLYETIAKLGGIPIMWKTGHSLIKNKMKEEKALLAGEMSGHIFFADKWFGFDDGVYASLRLIEILSQNNIPLSEYLKDIPKMYSTPEIRKECPDEVKFKVVERLIKKFKNEGLNVIDVDGARIEFKEGWALVRASNTQPVLVLRFEAETEEFLKRLQDIVYKSLEEILKEV
ncbi:phosphoglucomutase/phosphomannomutase alpha/beta/alpha domain III [Thermodesulfobacterium geofontis OPF15]|jgi:phosphomannomutase/phosphoglucomutase|uniref:Phosphoglucomutase/phosphomannomutase alpha/beta/alpha domain III n=1 Tax=Thermodesulfobacterium geofontis (strain OPF15) TaxID=795359 RepID=F8C2V2_THEGP|nr:phosphomannomutase/phosphoglucomutase [Thermodesulfobacterium geofontis]AEH22329.1 phosphoglucomutase/phosphomannomutase alpha/beta/alpha domain III [Thermodesulfobacterium geofontis OPF15]